MQKLAEICIRRPVFAAMLILALVVSAPPPTCASASTASPPSTSRRCACARRCRAPRPRRSRREVAAAPRRGGQHASRASTSCARSRRRASIVMAATFDLERDIDVAAQDVRDRVSAVLRELPPDARPADRSRSSTTTSSPVLTVALSADLLAARADRARRQDRQACSSSASRGVGEVAIVGGLERAINIWVDADRLAAYELPITDGPRRASCGRTPTCPAATSPTPTASDAAHAGPLHRPGGVQRPRRRDAQRHARSASATSAAPRTAPRSSARSRGSTACRRSSSRCAASPAPTPSR